MQTEKYSGANKMLWAVGTGRCGMQNWTLWQGGEIESEAKLRRLALEWYWDKSTPLDYAREKFLERMGIGVVGFADCCQYMFIDLIAELDPKASFHWLMRDKKDCVNALMQKVGEDQRLHPKGWVFDTERKRELLEWYYDEVNSIIRRTLIGKRFSLIQTESMPRLVP